MMSHLLAAIRRRLSKNIEPMGLKGSMEMVIQRGDGSVEVLRKDNLIVDSGFAFVCDSLGAAAGRPGVLSHIAVGTNNTATDAAQTALLSELNRQAATFTKISAKQFKVVANFAAGVATGAITEAGVFNAAADGVMFDRVVFNVINKGVDDTLTVTFTFTLS